MTQSITFTSAVFGVFAEAYLCFLVSASAKKMPRIKFSGILKNSSPGKSNVSNISNIPKLDFITENIYCIIHRSLYSLFIFFCSLLSVSKKQNIGKMLALPYSYNWQKLNEKKKPKVSEYGHPEYVSRQIISRILELLLRGFDCLIFHCHENFTMLLVW